MKPVPVHLRLGDRGQGPSQTSPDDPTKPSEIRFHCTSGFRCHLALRASRQIPVARLSGPLEFGLLSHFQLGGRARKIGTKHRLKRPLEVWRARSHPSPTARGIVKGEGHDDGRAVSLNAKQNQTTTSTRRRGARRTQPPRTTGAATSALRGSERNSGHSSSLG
jgi:hypothetical protein